MLINPKLIIISIMSRIAQFYFIDSLYHMLSLDFFCFQRVLDYVTLTFQCLRLSSKFCCMYCFAFYTIL